MVLGEGRRRLKLEVAAARRELERVACKESLATCDAVIREQAAVIAKLWKVLEWAGVSQSQAMGPRLDRHVSSGCKEGRRRFIRLGLSISLGTFAKQHIGYCRHLYIVRCQESELSVGSH